MIEDIVMVAMLGIGLALISFMVLTLIFFGIANAVIADPAGDCAIYEYPYIQLCEANKLMEKNNELLEKFLERAKEWNNTH